MGGCGWGGGDIGREIRIVTLCNQLLLQFTPGLYQTNTLLYGVHLRHTCDFSMTIIIFTEIMTIWIRHYFNNIFSSWNLCCVINSCNNFHPSSLKRWRMLTNELTIFTCYYEPALKYDWCGCWPCLYYILNQWTLLESGLSILYWFSKWPPLTWNN